MPINPDHLEQMTERVVELGRIYAIWHTLVDETEQSTRAAVIENYKDYFATSSQALFQAFSGIAYQLFETRKGTISLTGIVSMLVKTSPSVAQPIQDDIANDKPILSKLFSIRSNVYAHRNDKKTPENTFLAARLTPTEMERVVSLAQSVVVRIADALGKPDSSELEAEFKLRSECTTQDTKRVLQCLAKNPI